jgi:putative phage-type endonuclease
MDLAAWCDLYLPTVYNHGLFDDEETTDEVWESVSRMIDEFIEASQIQDSESFKESLLDTAGDWFRNLRDVEIEGLESVPAAQIQAIIDAPQTIQHSADWYTQRRNRLTASEFYQILTGSRERLLKSKLEVQGDRPAMSPVALAQPDGEMVATSWGHRFEPVVRDIYELETGSTVFDRLGRFTHRDYKWFSASPDGIVTKGSTAGRLIEIKAPKNRQPGTYVPAEYYVQMQVQMEVTDLEAVDFIEAQFDQVLTYSAVHEVDQVEHIHEGCTWTGQINVYGVLEDSTSWSYAYSRPVKSKSEIQMPPSDLPLLESSIWTLKAWFPRTVLRNRTWWDTVGRPEAELFWAEVLSRRDLPSASTIEHVGGWLGS